MSLRPIKPLFKKKNPLTGIQIMGFFYKNDVPEGCGILFPNYEPQMKHYYKIIKECKDHILGRYQKYSSYMKKEYLGVVFSDLKKYLKEYNKDHDGMKPNTYTEIDNLIQSHLKIVKMCGIIWFLTEISEIPNDDLNGTMFGYGK